MSPCPVSDRVMLEWRKVPFDGGLVGEMRCPDAVACAWWHYPCPTHVFGFSKHGTAPADEVIVVGEVSSPAQALGVAAAWVIRQRQRARREWETRVGLGKLFVLLSQLANPELEPSRPS